MKFKSIHTFVVILIITYFMTFGSYKANAMIFKSDKIPGMWDTWCYYNKGTFYLYYLVTEYSGGEGFGVATSKDGVHWDDKGWAIRQSTKNTSFLGTGSVWKSVDFETSGKFICNYSENRKDKEGNNFQNILFAWSTDLVNWTKFDDATIFKNDGTHYDASGRWDCIFGFPREEGGYWGTWTVNGNKGTNEGVGIGYTLDGLKWNALPIAECDPGVQESGAIYPINGKYYGLFGKNGSMRSYVSDKATGPYKESTVNPMLLKAGATYFARFLPTDEALLVNHHSITGTHLGYAERRVISYLSPFKETFVDKFGVMRWKYWKGNEALKGEKITTFKKENTHKIYYSNNLDLNVGIVVEATVKIPKKDIDSKIIFFTIADTNYGLRILQNGIVEMGVLGENNEWRKRFSIDREINLNGEQLLRVHLRAGMMEVYLGNHFIDGWKMECYGAKNVKVGTTKNDTLKDLNIWQMSLKRTNVRELPIAHKATTIVKNNDGASDYIQQDFEHERKIKSISIKWKNSYKRTYKVQVSNTGKDWETIFEVVKSDRKNGDKINSFDYRNNDFLSNLNKSNISAKSIRITYNDPKNRDKYLVNSFKVYDGEIDVNVNRPNIILAEFDNAIYKDWQTEEKIYDANTFKIKRKYLNFLVHEKFHDQQTAYNITVGGEIIGHVTPNTKSSKKIYSLNLREFMGRLAIIEPVNNNKSTSTIKQISLTDTPIDTMLSSH